MKTLLIILIVSITTVILSACTNTPSPQNTRPTHAAKCKALKMHMMPIGNQNNTPSAVLESDQDNLRDTYKQECEGK